MNSDMPSRAFLSKMNDIKRVSVIIPTRNRSRMLMRSIASVISQDYSNIEVIISNNASSDDTVEVIKEARRRYPKLMAIHHQDCLELHLHWDKVIKNNATGDYLMVISDDDILIDNSYVTKAVNILRSNPSIGVVFGNYHVVNSLGVRTSSIYADFDEFIPGDSLFSSYNKTLYGIPGIGIPLLTAVFTAEAYHSCGGFDIPCISCDTYLWLKILLSYDAGFVKDYVAEYMVHGGNISSNGNLDQLYNDATIPLYVGNYADSLNIPVARICSTLERMNFIFFRRYHRALLSSLFSRNIRLRHLFAINPNYLWRSILYRIMRR